MNNDVIAKWKALNTNDQIYKKDLTSLKEKQIISQFQAPLSFGTAGIRGIMGFGSSKINELTIASASFAYSQYLLNHIENSASKGIVIGHDNRHNSQFFAEIASRVLKAQGIKTFLYESNELQPTPLISYTIRKLKLAGGIIITASHNPKEYNGFKVYNELGCQLLNDQTKIIQMFMKDVDPFTIKQDQGAFSYINNNIVDSYIEAVLKTRLRPKDQKVLKVVFSPQHGTSAKIGDKLLSLMDIEHYNVKKQMVPNPDFKYTKTPNPEDGRSFKRAISLARRKHADLVAITDPDADRLGVAVKYKRRYKYLNGNEVAALYLDYLIKQLKKANKLPANAFIVKSVVSGNLCEKIAQRHKINVYETHVGFKNVAQVIEEKTQGGENFLFAYEESYGFLLDSNIARDKDSLQALVGVVEMANYYKSQHLDLYSQLTNLWNQYGIHRSTVQSQILSLQAQKKLLNRIVKIKNIDGQKIVAIEDYRQGINHLEKQDLIKIILKNGSWFAIRPSGTEPKLKTYIETVGTEKDDVINVVILEKTITNLILDNTEVEDRPRVRKRDVIKYIIFFLIIIAALYLVFRFVYKSFEGESVLDIAKHVFKQFAKWRIVWISAIIWAFFSVVILDAWCKKRLLSLQNQKVPLRYLIVSSVMGSIISFITPLSIGGDAIVYWYLRKKGVSRGPLISTLVSSLILHQTRIVLQTLILLPIGFPLYAEFLANGSPQAKASLVLFIIGLSWNTFSTMMIFMLALNRNFQQWILVRSITFLEWLPFIKIYDPGIIYGKVQYEFNQMRVGMRTLWKKWWVTFEMLFYFLLPVFFNVQAIILWQGGFINPDITRGPYWSQIIANDVIVTSNSLSLTPGGSGTLEWLTVNINQKLFQGSEFQKTTGINAEAIASGIDLNWKIISNWPMLLFSSLLIGNILIGETRVKKYKIINKNRKLSGENIGRNTRVYYFTAIPWFCILITWIALIFFIPIL